MDALQHKDLRRADSLFGLSAPDATDVNARDIWIFVHAGMNFAVPFSEIYASGAVCLTCIAEGK